MELADIVRAAGPAYVHTHAGHVLASQRRALDDIAQCRTPALGGSLYRCTDCGALDYRYHSYRNPHCPKCQDDRAQRWLVRVEQRLLPCDHYLLTFTLPHELRAVAAVHQRIVYAALLREAAAAVLRLTDDRAWVGGQPAILAVLHTWSRTLEYHPHAHLLVSAGGLTADGQAWVRPAHSRFLLPGYALSSIFRAKMRAGLTRAGLASAIDPRVWQHRWNVHVQAIGGGAQAIRYLARYVFRVALTNRRLTRFADGQVCFQYTHARTQETRSLTLPVDAFLRRFLQHVLPRGFTKIRWYGLLSPGRRGALERARELLATQPAPPDAASHAPHTSHSGSAARAAAEAIAKDSGGGSIAPPQHCAVCHRGLCVLVRRDRRTAPPRAPP
jgi:hypothetical protein